MPDARWVHRKCEMRADDCSRSPCVCGGRVQSSGKGFLNRAYPWPTIRLRIGYYCKFTSEAVSTWEITWEWRTFVSSAVVLPYVGFGLKPRGSPPIHHYPPWVRR